MVILHEPEHPRLNLKQYLLCKSMVFELYLMKKEAQARPIIKEVNALKVRLIFYCSLIFRLIFYRSLHFREK